MLSVFILMFFSCMCLHVCMLFVGGDNVFVSLFIMFVLFSCVCIRVSVCYCVFVSFQISVFLSIVMFVLYVPVYVSCMLFFVYVSGVSLSFMLVSLECMSERRSR